MKKLLLVPLLAAACLCLLAAPALAATTVTVYPAGKTADMKHNADTVDIKAAFKAAIAAGPGSTVQLAAGHFYINNILVTGFFGTFTGAGEGQTVIDCLRGLNPSLRGVTVFSGHLAPALLLFQDGAVRVSDMSFDITPAAPAEEWSNDVFGGPNDYLMDPLLLYGESSAAVDQVSFTGHAGDFYGMNTDKSVWVQPDALGGANVVFAMTRCTCATLEGVGHSGIDLVGARITIGGHAGQGNVFESAGDACQFMDAWGSHIVVSHNRFQVGNDFNGALTSNGVEFDQGVSAINGGGAGATGAPSHYLVSDNTMCVAPPANGVTFVDFGPLVGAGKLLDAVVSGNTMVLAGSLALDPVVNAAGIGEYYAQDVYVLDNRISGTGWCGIYLGTALVGDDAPGSVSGWHIIGNDVRCVAAQAAPIYLGPGTTDCTVIGGPRPTYVLNEGTDNTLIDATDLPAAAATTMHAMKQTRAPDPSQPVRSHQLVDQRLPRCL